MLSSSLNVHLCDLLRKTSVVNEKSFSREGHDRAVHGYRGLDGFTRRMLFQKEIRVQSFIQNSELRVNSS